MKCAIVVLLLLVSVSTFAVTIHVPADQPTIQAGIDFAAAGDTVLVAPGIYTGDGNRDLSFGGKAIALCSESGPTSTIIDCQGTSENNHRGFVFENGEKPASILDGFTITNGLAAGVGGAILCNASSPSIINCIFKNNLSTGSGGGIYMDHCAPTVKLCLFVNNKAPDQGGACFLNYTMAVFFNCTFYQNGAGQGGGAIHTNYSAPVLYNSLITNGTLGAAAYVEEGRNYYIDFNCCNIWGNGGRDWILGYNTQLGIKGNISEDPLYCADVPTVFPDDLYLSSQSPCAPENHECGALVGCYDVGCGPTAVEDDLTSDVLPAGFTLAQNYPNPFNPATRISFDLARGCHVRLKVFNVLGQQVAILVDEYRPAGQYAAMWDGSDLTSGVYLYRLKAGDFMQTKKMLMLK